MKHMRTWAGLLLAMAMLFLSACGDAAESSSADAQDGETGASALLQFELPEEGDEVTVGEPFADVESVKAVSDVYSPVSGVISEINEELLDTPEAINEAPYDAWFVRVKEITDTEELLDAEGYEAVVAAEEA